MDRTRFNQTVASNRPRMVGSVIHQALSQILETQISDPRIAQTTITEVELSKDLKHVKVFLTSSQSAEFLEQSVTNLNRAKAYIRHRLSEQIDLKFTPAVRFLADDLPSRSNRVLALIDQATNSSE